MAKFQDTLKNSTLTYSKLPSSITKKIDDMEKMYETYEKAYDAKDKETYTKLANDLNKKDAEIDELIKKHMATLAEPKVEEKPVEKTETKTEPKAEEVKKRRY